MSRIYEALLRARTERRSKQNPDAVEDGLDLPEIRDYSHLERFRTTDPQQGPGGNYAAGAANQGFNTNGSAGPASWGGTPEAGSPARHPIALVPHQERRAVPRAPKTPEVRDASRPGELRGVPSEWRPSLRLLPSLLERGSAVEQFRGLRSRIHEFRDFNTLKTILISSGLPAEGKSFVAANLAVSLARYRNSRVLLIDGDMRRGSLHKLLGTTSSPGLTEYLSGRCSLQEVVQQSVQHAASASEHASKTKIRPLPNLSFIPCGKDAENAADLSGNGRFKTLLDEVYPLYDWIVVDSSPVNLVADGVNLARLCDGVLLVTRGGVTRFPTAQRAVAELKASKVLGVVLNAVKDPPPVGGYYGYTGYDRVPETGATLDQTVPELSSGEEDAEQSGTPVRRSQAMQEATDGAAAR